MKQPENKIELDYVWEMEMGWDKHGYVVYVDEVEGELVDIGYGYTKRTALKAAIKRLHRLAADAEQMLEKLE